MIASSFALRQLHTIVRLRAAEASRFHALAYESDRNDDNPTHVPYCDRTVLQLRWIKAATVNHCQGTFRRPSLFALRDHSRPLLNLRTVHGACGVKVKEHVN